MENVIDKIQNSDYSKVHNLEKTISFCVSSEDECTSSITINKFAVPYSWAENWIKNNQNMTIEQFLDEYTSEESSDMHFDALMEGVLIKDMEEK